MTRLPIDVGTATELCPCLLFRREEGSARLATWQIDTGHEALALFTCEETAEKYRGELADAKEWAVHQPSRDNLLDILQACRSTGIVYACLDPCGGRAKTLFDVLQMLRSAVGDG